MNFCSPQSCKLKFKIILYRRFPKINTPPEQNNIFNKQFSLNDKFVNKSRIKIAELKSKIKFISIIIFSKKYYLSMYRKSTKRCIFRLEIQSRGSEFTVRACVVPYKLEFCYTDRRIIWISHKIKLSKKIAFFGPITIYSKSFVKGIRAMPSTTWADPLEIQINI